MSATISAVETRLFRLPLPVTLSDRAHGDMPDFELVTITLTDDSGASGTGYTYTVGHGGTAILAQLRDEVTPLLNGVDSGAIEAVLGLVNRNLHWGGRGGPTAMAISALDIALWDLMGHRANLPLWRLLGGFDPAVPCYAGGIDLDFTIDALLKQADTFVASGIRAIKMKAGRTRLSEDIERCAAMREHLGHDFPLMVDANMGWTVPKAIQAGRAFEPFNLVWMEEPIDPDNIDGHRAVADATSVPIATGENLRSVAEFRHLIQARGVHYPEPDPTNCGGVSAFMKIARLAEAHGLSVTSHGVHDICVHLLAAAPNRSFLELHGFSLDPYIEEPLELRGGMAIAPERAGHGVTFRWDVMKEYERSGQS